MPQYRWQHADTRPMAQAIDLAKQAAAIGEVPVGAVIVHQDRGVIAFAHNRVETDQDPTAHAEILAIRAAAASLHSKSLDHCDIYVTLEPCAMCAQAIAAARIRRLYYAADDPKGGAVDHGPRLYQQPTCHHRPEVISGIEADASAALLRDFFRERR